MEEIIKTKRYGSLKDFLDAISYKGELYDIFSKNYIFRGLPSSKYELVPSALRKENEEELYRLCHFINPGKEKNSEDSQMILEYKILSTFYLECDKNQLSIPNIDIIRDSMTSLLPDLKNIEQISKEWLLHDFYEIAALAQHYGLPTRLLDWSKNIYTALYFAAIYNLNKNKRDDYMVLWALNASLAVQLNTPLKIIIPAYYRNPNLGAQEGVFTLWGEGVKTWSADSNVDRRPLDVRTANYLSNKREILDCSDLFYKFFIPTDGSNELLEYLHRLGFDSARLFPGYSGVVKDIKEKAEMFQFQHQDEVKK